MKKRPAKTDAIRPMYDEFGSIGYYKRFGAAYRNPHEPIIVRLIQQAVTDYALDTSRVLDLACGSGEMTMALRAVGATEVVGVDPFTGEAYHARTGQTALPYTFEQIGEGVLADEQFSLIVCSFALHLADDSRLPVLCYQLSRIAAVLVVITPIKRPHIEEAWGWTMEAEVMLERVRLRLYRSGLGEKSIEEE
jgi:SAM-dependent methyltransferase